MNTFTLGACFQHELHTGPYFTTFALRLLCIKSKSTSFSPKRFNVWTEPEKMNEIFLSVTAEGAV